MFTRCLKGTSTILVLPNPGKSSAASLPGLSLKEQILAVVQETAKGIVWTLG